MCVRSGRSLEWMCFVDMSRAMSITPVLQTHGNCKAGLWWGSEEQQSLPLLQVWMLTAYAETQPQLPPSRWFRPKTAALHRPCSAVYSKPSSGPDAGDKHAEFLVAVAAIGGASPSGPAFLHMLCVCHFFPFVNSCQARFPEPSHARCFSF